MLLALAAGAAATTAEPDLATQWVVEDSNQLCAVVRGFASDEAAAIVRIMPWPIGVRTEISIITDGSRAASVAGSGRLVSDAAGTAQGRLNASALMLSDARFGRGTLRIGAAAPIAGGVATGIEPATRPDDLDLRYTTIDVQQALPELSDGDRLTIASEVVATPTITLTGMVEARAKLRSCQAAQLARWGVAADEVARIAIPPTPSTAGVTAWFSSNNYPRAALKAREEGIVIVRWRIETDGRTSDCAAVQSSGSAVLDAAACAVILRHRFSTPALDAAGKPMVSHGLRRVAWRLPR